MAVVEFHDLTLSLNVAGKRADVLRGIALNVEPGSMLGLVGESGAGKSMIGRVIAGEIPPGFAVTQGAVRFEGRDLLALPRRQHRALLGRRIAFVPQEPLSGLNPVLTVRQQLFEHLAHVGAPKAQWRQMALDRLAEVGLPNGQAILRRYPHQLSGGQCQRILIAMAFCGEPALIVADEPTTALDVMTQAQIMRVLRAQQRRHGTAVVLITHDLRMAAHVCDRVAVLYAGEVVEYGSAAQVLDKPIHPYTLSLKIAAPALQGERVALPSLPDFMPAVSDFPDIQGCRYYSRCAVRKPECETQPPFLLARDEGRLARCLAVIPAADRGAAQAAPVLPAGDRQAKPLVELRNVSLSYPGRSGLWKKADPIQVVQPVSFSVAPGEFLGIVGESGSGKTSMARLLMGLVPPTGGSILIDGQDRHTADAGQARALRKCVQMVFQNPDSALNPRRRVADLVTQILEADGAGSEQAADRMAAAQRLMQAVGLSPSTLGRLPSQLSGGQKQRVNIARALCLTPRMLVADEIVSGLDVSVQALILNLLLRLNRELGIGLVFISHDLAVVRYLCNRVMVMYRGVVVEAGETEQVFKAPRHEYTRALIAAVPPEAGNALWPPVLPATAA
ncbi:ABC transporter ATP-binding protein [Bordetella sp. FB-8]|uniref:dipeptide ABC transporter ATP-binding protein n=1 Tax=Bordetella sp. FB-8 TaxID=1159870 RepID=UPI00037C3636|nr:ABC transporter ATP-binding protein [Bordetella sp. FB-8]